MHQSEWKQDVRLKWPYAREGSDGRRREKDVVSGISFDMEGWRWGGVTLAPMPLRAFHSTQRVQKIARCTGVVEQQWEGTLYLVYLYRPPLVKKLSTQLRSSRFLYMHVFSLLCPCARRQETTATTRNGGSRDRPTDGSRRQRPSHSPAARSRGRCSPPSTPRPGSACTGLTRRWRTAAAGACIESNRTSHIGCRQPTGEE